MRRRGLAVSTDDGRLEAAKIAAEAPTIAAATVAPDAASVVVAVTAVMVRTAVRSAAVVGHDA